MAAGSTIAKLFVELGFKGDALTKGSNKAQGDLKKLGNKAKSVGKMVDKAVTAGFVAATAAISAFGVAAATTGAKFEKAMTLVGVLSGATGKALQSLEDRARELGATTAYTATEAAEGMQALARAGLSADEIIRATGQALYFAGANATTMEASTNLLAATMAQFNIGAHESGRIVDVYTSAINNSLLDTTSLAEAMKYAGSVGSSFGMTLEETTASIAMFRNMGLEGSLAGTNFRMAMIQASKATTRKTRVLAKYGLAMKDISPEMFTFSEIMTTIGKTSMGTSDAIEVFGARAGANIARISAEIAENSDRWQQVNAAIADSAGLTESNYLTMMNTVSGQWDILKSVVQEMQLTLFEGFGQGLKELLTALQDLILFTTDFMSTGSGSIANDWNAAMLNMAQSIRKNKATIVAYIIEIVQFFTMLGEKALWIVKHFRVLASVLLAVWATTKVYAFIGVIHLLSGALVTATGAATGLAVAVNTATAGIPALISALVAGGSLLAYLASSSDDASEAALRLQRHQRALAKAVEATNETVRLMMQANDEESDRGLHNLEMRLNAQGILNNIYRRELETVREMGAEQKQAALHAGQLVEVMIDGNSAFISTTTAARLAQEEGTDAALDMGQALQANANEIRKQIALKEQDIKVIRDRVAAMEHARELLKDGMAEGGVEYEDEDLIAEYGTTQAAIQDARRHTAKDWVRQEAIAAQEVERLNTQLQGQLRIIGDTGAAIERERQQHKISLEKSDADKRKSIWEKLQKDRLAAAKKTDKLIRDSIRNLAAAGGDDFKVWKMGLEDRLKAAEETFAEEIALWKGHNKKITELEMNKALTLARIRETEGVEALEALKSQLSDQYIENKKADETKLESMRREHSAELLQARNHEDRMIAAHEEGTSEWYSAQEEAGSIIHQLMSAQQQEIGGVQRREQTIRLKELHKEQLDITRAQMPEYLALESSINEEIADAEYASQKERLAMAEVHDEQRIALRKRLSGQVLQVVEQDSSEEVKLAKERDALLAMLPEDMGRERLLVEKYYADAIAKVKAEAAEDETDEGKINVLAGLVSGFKAVISVAGQAQAAFSRVMDTLAAISGFAFNLSDAVAEISGQMQELTALEAELEAGEITGAEYLEGIEDLPATAAEAAQTFVTELMAGAIATVQAFVEAAPVLMEELAAQLPDLLTAIADGLVTIIQTVADNIEPIVSAVAKAAPDIMDALVEGLPILLNAIIAAIPTLLGMLLDALPLIITMLTDAVVALIAALPKIIQQLAAALPGIITTLFESLDQIIVALVDAIPKIIGAIIDNLPAIVMALLNGILLLITTILEQLPILITALVELLPDLVGALVDLIPQIITALVDALPDILTALLEMIPVIMAAIIVAMAEIQAMIIEAIPEILAAIFVELIPGLGLASIEMAKQFVVGMYKFFRDLIKEIVSLGAKKTETFGDTPGVIQAGSSGLTAGFAPGDYVVAAQNKEDMLDQILGAMTGGVARAMSSTSAPSLDAPAISGLGPAVMQAAGSMGSTASPMRVTVTAEGKTLDDVLYVAGTRGGTPKLQKSLRKASGATVGFSRGRYANSSST